MAKQYRFWRTNFALTAAEKLDAKAALNAIDGTGLSLTDVAVIAAANHIAEKAGVERRSGVDVRTLNGADLLAIGELIDARLGGRRLLGPVVMNLNEATEYVGKRSSKAFYSWCKAWHVYACGQGRYARTKLDLGLDRESRGIRERRKRD